MRKGMRREEREWRAHERWPCTTPPPTMRLAVGKTLGNLLCGCMLLLVTDCKCIHNTRR